MNSHSLSQSNRILFYFILILFLYCSTGFYKCPPLFFISTSNVLTRAPSFLTGKLVPANCLLCSSSPILDISHFLFGIQRILLHAQGQSFFFKNSLPSLPVFIAEMLLVSLPFLFCMSRSTHLSVLSSLSHLKTSKRKKEKERKRKTKR